MGKASFFLSLSSPSPSSSSSLIIWKESTPKKSLNHSLARTVSHVYAELQGKLGKWAPDLGVRFLLLTHRSGDVLD